MKNKLSKKKVALSEICEINPSVSEVRELDDDLEVSFIPMTNVSEYGTLKLSETRYLKDVKKGFTYFKNGDVLFAKITPCMENGKGAVANQLKNEIGFGSTEFHVLRPTNTVISRWIYYLTASKEFRKIAESNMTGSAGQKRVPKQFFDKYKINLVPLEYQGKVIKALDKARELIDKRKVQIEALDELVKSRFIEMFGDPITNSKGWNTARLGDICIISRGGSPRPIDKFLGGPIPWIKIGDATQGDDIYLHKTKEGIIEEGIKKSRLIKKGGLIFANCGVSLGFARILKIDGCIHDGWLAFEGFDESLDKIFFLKSLNYCTGYFRRIAPDGTQPNLNTNIMRQYVQILPPMELQQEFAAFIEQVDKLKFEMETSLK